MKWIFEHMLGAVIIGTVVLGLLFIINNITVTAKNEEKTRGFLNIIGTQFKEQQNSNKVVSDTSDIFKKVVEQKKPEIIFTENGQEKIKSNVYINILNYFKVRYFGNINVQDAASLNDKELRIVNITDINGESVLDAYDSTNKIVFFSDYGVFTIEFCITDSENQVTSAVVRIPIDS